MQKRKKLLITAVVLAVALAYSVYADLFHVYTLRDDNGGTMLWNSNEAYLFMSEVRRGYRMNWPAFAVSALFEWFNAHPLPTDQRVFFIVIHVTPDGVERHVAKITTDTAAIPHFFTPVGQTIYAFSEGSISKLSGDHFELATADERARVGGLEHLWSDVDRTVNGWSEKGVGKVAGDFEFSVQIGKDTTLKIHQGNLYKSAADSPTVDLYRTGQPALQLWRVDGEPHWVSKKNNQRALRQPARN